jgi:hypothetical protein
VRHHERKLWKGGNNKVLTSITAGIADCKNLPVERLEVCPECLAYAHRSSTCTWSWDWDNLRAASDPVVRCTFVHQADGFLTCGAIPAISKFDGGKVRDGRIHTVFALDGTPHYRHHRHIETIPH